jgi:hypothetical protein
MMKFTFLSLVASIALCPLAAQAISVEELAAQIRADQAFVAAHPEDTETVRLVHSAQMCAEMHRVEDQVQAWRAEAKASFAAPGIAQAQARKDAQPIVTSYSSADSDGYKSSAVLKTYNAR